MPDFYDRKHIPDHIELRGAKENNLKNIDINIPLNSFVAICGVSGSGKSTLAMDVLYAEGSRRYLQSLSTYTRRRIGQTSRPNVESVRFLPSAIALRQRPVVPNVRSTVGTMSEVLNIWRLAFSRLGSHVCPNGHRQPPSFDVAHICETRCSICDTKFNPPGAEDFAFNSGGACPKCHGTGEIEEINENALIGDENKTIRDGAVRGWRVPGSFFYVPTAEKLGIPVDIPYKNLTDDQKEMVLHGPRKDKIPVVVKSNSGQEFKLEATYLNAADAVHHAYSKTESETVRSRRAAKFYHIGRCPMCNGSRFAPRLLNTLLDGKNIAEISSLSLIDLKKFAESVPDKLPTVMKSFAEKLMGEVIYGLKPLLELGLSYLSLDRSGNSLSTGELQRIQLARTLKNETTGVLYVLDEPSIGLHPINVDGLINVFHQLIAQGNSLVVVDHDLDILRRADWLIELGQGAGRLGGNVVFEGTVEQIERISEQNRNIDKTEKISEFNESKQRRSVIAHYLSGKESLLVRNSEKKSSKQIYLSVNEIYTLKNLQVEFPIGKLTAVTGVSGSGKSTLILDCLVPAINSVLKKTDLPQHISAVELSGIKRVVMIDAVPVGKNTRSTVATYSGIFDEIRSVFAETPAATSRNMNAGHFSHNLKSGVCSTCMGTGEISLDIQYLPDMDIVCPDCGGQRYSKEVLAIKWKGLNIAEILELSIDEAIETFKNHQNIREKLNSLSGLGLGYLKLGESTTQLSGGEAQRLKLVSEMGKNQKGTLFVFDEPTTGLHPKDIRKLLQVIDSLICNGGTVIVIEHDLDMIANADHIIDMGPEGGSKGGKIIATGSPSEICADISSITGRYLKKYAGNYGILW